MSRFLSKKPVIGKNVFISNSSDIIGDVSLKDDSSVWFNAVVRGDFSSIIVGVGSNIQDNSVVHVDDKISTSVGDYTTIGHNCIIHGCNIGSYSLIGMGSIILNGAVIGNNCIIGAGTLITQNSEIPDNSLVFGSPGKIIRTITNDEKNKIKLNADTYIELKNKYLEENNS